jgi:alkaline phosphatase
MRFKFFGSFWLVLCLFTFGVGSAIWATHEDHGEHQYATCPAPTLPSEIKNVIMMIGDGMGPEQVNLGRLFAPGGNLVMDDLDPAPGQMTTHDVTGGVTDSAAAATAMATGQKTINGYVSVDENAEPLWTVLESAREQNMVTGLVSSVFLIDATPAVWAVHSASRYNYSELALQQGDGGVEVLLGAGRMNYLPKGANGTGGPNLIDELQAQGYEYVRKERELLRANGPKLLGFFGGTAMTYNLNRPSKKGLTEPTLAQMADKAIEILSGSADGDSQVPGFFLMVEGGAIDWLAHKLDAAGTLREVQAFDEAVAVAYEFAASRNDTLLVVTADHETGGLMLGNVNKDFVEGITATTDIIHGKIQSGMSIEDALDAYAGIGSKWPPLTAQEKQQIQSCGEELGVSDVLSARSGVSWAWSGCEGGNHTGELIDVFAYGPGSDAFDGSDLDNTDIGCLLFDAVSND